MDDDKFLIHVDIAGKSYGLRIKRSDEESVREAAKYIQQKLGQYRQRFSETEVELKDLLAMVALQLSIDRVQLKDRNDTTPFSDKIKQLTDLLEVYLKDK